MSALLSATRAELTKIISLRIAWIVTGVIVALHLLISWANLSHNVQAVAHITPDGIIEIFTGEPKPANKAILNLDVSFSLQIVAMFLPIIAAVIAGQEFRSNQLGLSVLAVPRRGLLLVAKSIATGLFMLFVTLVIQAITNAFMYMAIRDWNPGLLYTHDALVGQGKLTLMAVLICLVSFAITTIARSTLIGIVVTVVLTAVTMTQLLAKSVPALDALFPLSAGRNLLLDPTSNQLSATPEHAMFVLIAWPLLAMALAGYTLSKRDAR